MNMSLSINISSPMDLPRGVLRAHVIPCLDVRSAARLRRVNRAFYALIDPAARTTSGEMKRLQRINRLRYHNALWTLITKYPDKKWSHRWVSGHENITLDIILSNPQFPWDWYYVSQNPNITIEMVLEHVELPWW